MSRRSTAALAVLAALLPLVTAGCAFRRGPEDVRSEVDRQLGCDLAREAGLHLGPLSTRLALSLAGSAEGDLGPLRGVSRFEVGVYAVPAERRGSSRGHLDPSRFAGWEPIVRIRDQDGEALVLARLERGRVRGLLLIARDEDEVVIARLRGDLQRLLEEMVRDADDGAGTAGVKGTAELASDRR